MNSIAYEFDFEELFAEAERMAAGGKDENGCTNECQHAIFAFDIPPTEEELAEDKRYEEYCATFDVIFANAEHRQYEDEIRDFCRYHQHPRMMFFLHLPVAPDLTLDCEWDDERDCMIVTELEPEDVRTLDLPRPN